MLKIILHGGFGSSGEVTVLDLTGRVVLHRSQELAETVFISAEEPLCPGVYFIRISSEGITAGTRTVVIR